MASNRPRKRRASDDELVKALLETTNVGEVANRVGLHQSSVRRRLRSPQFRARLEAARGALKVNAREQVVDPGNSRSIEAHWKGQAERYSAQIQRELVVKSQRRKTGQERPHRWFIPVFGFTVRLVWAAFHLILFLAVISLLALIVLFVRYATVP
jgi:hypothetical protein